MVQTSLGGFEPSTYGLEGRCSIQLSYRLISLTTPKTNCFRKAGDGNRTHVSSLEGWCSTIELHPHVVGVTGFEPATSWSQTRRSSQAEPHPDVFFMLRHLRDTICLIGHVFLNVNTFFKFFYFLFFSEFFTVNASILPTFTPIHITALTDTLSQRIPFPLCLMSLPCSSAVCRSVLDRSYYPDST